MSQQITWSPGSAKDSDSLAKLLVQTNYQYRSLVLYNSSDMLVESESLLGWRGADLVSALVAGGDNSPVVDLQLAAASDSLELDQLIHEGLPLLEARVIAKGGRWLCILGGPDWLTRQLYPRYELVDTVIFYQRNRSPDILQPDPIKGLEVKGLANTDLVQINQVDNASFTPFWQADTTSLNHWLANANRALSLSAGNQIIAFIFARIQGDMGNIWRLAVLPEWQGKGLGGWLMARTIADMLADGAYTITLNTQDSNSRSRSLYEKLGFKATGQEVSVWARDLFLL